MYFFILMTFNFKKSNLILFKDLQEPCQFDIKFRMLFNKPKYSNIDSTLCKLFKVL